MFENITGRYDASDATIEIVVMLLVAFLLGLLLGYWLGKSKCEGSGEDDATVTEDSTVTPVASGQIVDDASTETVVSDSWKPTIMPKPSGAADDLKRISGVGPVIEKTLNEAGIYYYSQVAELTKDNIAWLDNYISFPGRIDRENWVGQAKDLVAGKETDFAGRYDKGETGAKKNS